MFTTVTQLPLQTMPRLPLALALLVNTLLLPPILVLAATPDLKPAGQTIPSRTQPAQSSTFEFTDPCAPQSTVKANLTAWFADIGEYDRALQIVQTMDSDAGQALVLVHLVDRLAVAGEYDRALQLAKTINPALPTFPFWYFSFEQTALYAIVGRMAEAGKPELALPIAQAMTEKTPTDKTQKGFALLRVSAALAKGGRQAEADRWFNQARTLMGSGEWPFGLINQFQPIAAAMIDSGQAKQLISLSQWQQSLGQSYLRQGLSVQLAEAGQADLAMQVVQQSGEQGSSKLFALTQLVQPLAKAGQVDEALQVVAQLKQDNFFFSFALSHVALVLIDRGEPERALALAKQIPFEDVEASVVAQVARDWVKRGEIDRALSLIETIALPELKASAMARLTDELLSKGQDNQVEVLLSRAEQLAQDKQGFLPQQTLARHHIAVGWAKVGDYGRALRVAQIIGDRSKRFQALQGIAEAQAIAGNGQRALQTAQLISDRRQQVNTILRVTSHLIKAEQLDQALQVTNVIQSDWRIEEQEPLGNFTQIFTGSNLKSAVQATIALKLAQSGQIDRALQLARSQPDDTMKAMILGRIVVELVNQDKVEQAEILLAEVQQLTQTLTPSKATASSCQPFVSPRQKQ